jgi:hypothetical protein
MNEVPVQNPPQTNVISDTKTDSAVITPEVAITTPDTPAINPPPVEIPKAKSPLIIIFVIIALVFIVLVIGMLVVKNLSGTHVTPSPTPITQETPVPQDDPTAKWTPYINKTLAFQIKTPKGWRVETNKEQVSTVWLKAPDESIIEIIATDSASLSLPDYIRRVSDETQTAWEGKPSKEFGEQIDTSVGDFTATEITVKYLAAGFETVVTYAAVDQRIFSFTVLPPASGDAIKNTAFENYSLILSTFKKYTPIDMSKWKTWTDPNEFTLMYPPNAKINHLNENTNLEVKTDSGIFTLSFCKNCVKDACIGICDKTSDIKIPVNGKVYAEKQISPNENGNFTFRVVLPYPNTFVREKLAIFGSYIFEENLEEMYSILSTFKFTEVKKN